MANLFTSPCQNLSDFTQEGGPYIPSGGTVTTQANAGKTGAGDYGLVITVDGTSNETGVRVGNVGGQGRSFSFDFKLGTFANLTGSLNLCHAWFGDTSTYGSDAFQLGITKQSSRTTSGYYFYLQTPLDSYAGLYYSGKVISDNGWHRVEVRISDDQIALYVDGNYQCYIRSAYKARNLRAMSLGKWYSTGYTGTLSFDNVSFDTVTVAGVASTYSARLAAAWSGWKNMFVRSDGAVVRHMGYPGADGSYGYSYAGSDIVSEGQAYGMIFAVQMGDQTTFDLLEAFAYTKLCRRNTSEVATAVNNASSSPLYQNIMGWKYQDDIGGFYDANGACDADNDRYKALMWAHGRWGSAGTINYKARADALLADLKQYTFKADTVSGATVQIQAADPISLSNTPFEVNPSYPDLTAFRLAKQYDTSNATFWQQVINGAYALLSANATQATYGGPTEWATWSTGTHTVGSDGARSDWQHWGYNSFRAPIRAYWDYYFYNDTRAQTYLTNSFRTFVANEWNTSSPQRLAMEMDGTGTRLYSGYEKTFGTYAKWLTQRIGTPTSVSSAIWNAKLDPNITFQNAGNGAFFGDNAGDLDPSTSGDTSGASYFGSSWGLLAYLTESGSLTNFGSGTVVTRTKSYTLDAVINTASLSTRTKPLTLDALLKKTLSKPFTMDALLTSASPTRQAPLTLDALLSTRQTVVFTLDAVMLPAPVGTQVSSPLTPARDFTLRDIISLCQELAATKDADAETLLRGFANLASKDLERDFSDHPNLRASTQFKLVPQVDLSYAFPGDFKSERFLRLVAPVNLAHPLSYVPYERFRASVPEIALLAYSVPHTWYWAPENASQIHVYPVPDQAYTVQLDYDRYAPDLVSDTDVPFFGREFHHLIAYRILWYFYSSSSVVQPDTADRWQGEFLEARRELKKSYQRRQRDRVRALYAADSSNLYPWR